MDDKKVVLAGGVSSYSVEWYDLKTKRWSMGKLEWTSQEKSP